MNFSINVKVAVIAYIHSMKLTNCIVYVMILALPACLTGKSFQMVTGYITTKDASIYYQSVGEGEPLLLLHAGFQDNAMWQSQVEELWEHFQVITIDLPGHGSTESDTVRSYPADFIKTVLDSLNISKTSIAGVSLGASCVTDFIIAHPEMVNKAILVAPGVNGWDRKFKIDTMLTNYVTSLFGALNNKDTAAAAEIFTKLWCDGPKRTPQQVSDTVRNYVYNKTLTSMKQHKVRGWPILADPPAIENLDKIRVPLLIVDGDQDVPYINEACSYIQSKVSGSKRITIPGTGHMLNMEDPKAFNKALLDFLKP